MIWTAGTPTKEGWYWFMVLDVSDEGIVNVYHTGSGVSDCWRRAVKTSIWSLSTATDWLDP